MKEKLRELTVALTAVLRDIEKVENKEYGYKSAAVRARKVCQKVSQELKILRKQIQESKMEGE